MARETKYPFELTTVIQNDEEQTVAHRRWIYLICLFFLVLAALAIVAMLKFPPTWDLSQ